MFDMYPVVTWLTEIPHLVWKNIELPMKTFMENIKAERLEKARRDVVTNRRELFRKYLESSSLFSQIPVVEASQFEPIRDLIEKSPVDYDLTTGDFEPFKCSLVAFSGDWAASKELPLLELVQTTSLALPKRDPAILKLATTFFRFDPFDEPIHSQDVFIHPSLFQRNWQPAVTLQRLFQDFNQATWNLSNRLSFHEPAFSAAQAILVSCNVKPPYLITAAEMDQWNPLLECKSCYSKTLGRLVMTWKQAVRLIFFSRNIRPSLLNMVLLRSSTRLSLHIRDRCHHSGSMSMLSIHITPKRPIKSWQYPHNIVVISAMLWGIMHLSMLTRLRG